MTGTRRANRESWIRETPNDRGYYEARVWMGTKPDGRPDRRHVERRTLRAVKARVRELERDRAAGLISKPGRVPTLAAMLIRHLDVVLPQRNRAPHTIIGYRSLCEQQIFPRWGGQKIDRLLPEWIEDGYAEMRAAGLAPSTIRKVHAICSSAYEIEVRRGNVGRNPFRLVEPPSLSQPGRPALDEAQARKALAAAQGRRNAARWTVGLACGLRQGEALGLRWPFVDLDGGQLQVWYQLQRLPWQHGCADPAACAEPRHKRPCPKRCPKIRKSGRRHVCVPADAPRLCPPGCTGHAAQCPDRHSGGLVFREIKERRRKTVPLPPELADLLRAHRELQDAERELAANEWREHGLVFCQPDGAPIDNRADWQEWADILAEAGLPHAGTHSMRHSAATIALDQGVALAVVQEMLGHADIRVTRGYTHVSTPLARDGAARLSGALLGEK
jgi:integrase